MTLFQLDRRDFPFPRQLGDVAEEGKHDSLSQELQLQTEGLRQKVVSLEDILRPIKEIYTEAFRNILEERGVHPNPKLVDGTRDISSDVVTEQQASGSLVADETTKEGNARAAPKRRKQATKKAIATRKKATRKKATRKKATKKKATKKATSGRR